MSCRAWCVSGCCLVGAVWWVFDAGFYRWSSSAVKGGAWCTTWMDEVRFVCGVQLREVTLTLSYLCCAVLCYIQCYIRGVQSVGTGGGIGHTRARREGASSSKAPVYGIMHFLRKKVTVGTNTSDLVRR